ncbi:hypothetical protein CCP2SC5_2750002 [Azospirillaceae bacterium]
MTDSVRPAPRHDWTVEELRVIYQSPLLELAYRAGDVHRAWHDPTDVQRASLLNIKTGGCGENCGYCSQSATIARSGSNASPSCPPKRC